MKPEVAATIARLIENAQRTDTSDKRVKLFDRYMGEPYGDEVKGRSSFISTDVSDAVEAILPDLMDVFTSAEQIAEFDPVGAEDEAAAKQETAVVSHIFWQKNPGYELLYTWIKESLIQQNSYVQRGWETKERVEILEYADLGPGELGLILSDPKYFGAEVELLRRKDGTLDVMTGEWTPEHVKIRIVHTSQEYVVEAFPQEEFFISPMWNRVCLDGVLCCGRRREIEAGELLRMGFDKRSIEDAHRGDTGDEYQTQSRFDTADLFEGDEEDAGDDSTRKITVYHTFARVDINGDGKAELVEAWAAGSGKMILKRGGKDAIEEVGSVPFSALTPYIVPHRHVGRSVAELVDDVQRVKTIMLRQTFDNIYSTQYTRPYFDETQAGVNLFNDLMNPAHGAPIRTGGALVEWTSPQPIIGTTLPVVQMMDDLKETRTGATRYNQGLDAESLNKTASGIKQIMNASQKKTLLIARTIAETGLRDLFLGMHRDLRAGPVKRIAIKLMGQWVQTDPTCWNERTDMTVKVGMGSGDRDQMRAGLMLMAQMQEKLAMSGSRMAGEQNFYAVAEKVMQTYGFKSIEPFLTTPDKLPPQQPPPPDPQVLMAQKQMQIMEQESLGRMQLDAQKAQMQHMRDMEALRLKAQAEERQQASAAAAMVNDDENIALARRKLALDDDFRRDQLNATTAATSEPPRER